MNLLRKMAMQVRLRARLRGARLRLRKSAPAPGFTLLEIILSLAIFAASFAALGEVMRMGDQSAARARDEALAQILASYVMDELLSGARDLTTVSQAEFDFATDPPLIFSVLIESTAYPEVVRVGVRVEEPLPPNRGPTSYEFYRWMLEPNYVAMLEEQEAQLAAAVAEAAAANTGGTDAGGTGTGAGGTGTGGTGTGGTGTGGTGTGGTGSTGGGGTGGSGRTSR